jgi:hypothetical protein
LDDLLLGAFAIFTDGKSVFLDFSILVPFSICVEQVRLEYYP